MMAFLRHIEVTKVETTGLQEAGSEITMTDDIRSVVNTCTENHLMSDTMCVPFAVFQDIMNTNIILQCTNFHI